MGKISSELNKTSNPHMRIFSILGVLIFPLHWSIPPANCRNSRAGSTLQRMKKYREESLWISSFPPSHTGKEPLIPVPMSARSRPRTAAIIMDWQNTALPFSRWPAPAYCATWTENPTTAALHSPPNSHVVLETSPMAAVAFAPRLPTIAASIYCMMVELIWARTAGMLKRITICICCFPEMVSPFSRYCVTDGTFAIM